MAVLINGDGYGPVTAQQDADLYAGILGDDMVVLNVGSKMAATIQSATIVRVADGEAVVQGRRIHINAGSYDDFEIPTGTQGNTVTYLIGYHYYRDSDDNEVIEQFVLAASQLTPGVIRDGTTDTRFPMYKVVQEGITLASVTPLYKMAANTPKQSIASLYGQINAQSVSSSYTYTTIPELANWNMVGVELKVQNCRELLIFPRGRNFAQLVSDRSGSTYVRGGCIVDWENNRVGIRCPNGSSTTLSSVYIAGVYGIY